VISRSTSAVAAALIVCGCAHAGPARMAAPAIAPAAGAAPAARIHFATASAAALPRYRPAMERNAGWLLENPGAVVVLEGHCDRRGSDAFNMELGDRRARWVLGELVSMGVPAKRLVVMSKGEREPIAQGNGPAALARNRRVEFIVR
jgi:peptidoglycan-associated lipoprotein